MSFERLLAGLAWLPNVHPNSSLIFLEGVVKIAHGLRQSPKNGDKNPGQAPRQHLDLEDKKNFSGLTQPKHERG